MRRVRYQVAMSLDGYIASPKGDYDWIPRGPDVDFAAMFRQFDTLLMGRRTYEDVKRGGPGMTGGLRLVVFSRTLRQSDCPDVTLVAERPAEAVNALRAQEGKDIWLFGGGSLFRSLLDLGVVDAVEVAVVPVLLGEGVPLLPPPARQTKLKLTGHKLYPETGIISLEYAVA
jgi:dihydrofolate reductase